MIALKVEDVKTFTSKLFLKEDFDSFLVKELTLSPTTIFPSTDTSDRDIIQMKSWRRTRLNSFPPGKCFAPYVFH
mgnify:FL=1